MKPINEKLYEVIKNKKAIIWDFDGVICFADWNYGEDVDIWWNRLWDLLEEYEPNLREKYRDGLSHFYEHTDYIAKTYGNGALKKINQFYLQKELLISTVSPINTELTQIIKDIDPSVEQYIWSNNQEQFIVSMLGKAGISDKFKAIVSRDKVIEAKPNLEGYRIIESSTQVEPNDFVFVGDSKISDGVAAQRIGADFFFYDLNIPTNDQYLNNS